MAEPGTIWNATPDDTTDIASIITALDDYCQASSNSDWSFRSGSLDPNADPPQVRSYEGGEFDSEEGVTLTPASRTLHGYFIDLFIQLKSVHPIWGN